jgi:hypothetical protein
MPQSRKARCIEIIQEQAAHIIYENRAYLNDENIRRLNVIEMNIENIKEQIEKIREEEAMKY